MDKDDVRRGLAKALSENAKDMAVAHGLRTVITFALSPDGPIVGLSSVEPPGADFSNALRRFADQVDAGLVTPGVGSIPKHQQS